MALNFPASPVDGQIYYDSTSGNRYVYKAATTKWEYTANNTPTGSVYLASSAPPGAVPGDLWWHQDLGKMFIYYSDGDSTQWVETSPSGGITPSAGVDFVKVYDETNTAFQVANAAFDFAGVTPVRKQGELAGNARALGIVHQCRPIYPNLRPPQTRP